MPKENAWLGRRVIGFAHQGGVAGGAPNTIAAMRTALANGSAGLEFDVHRTRDGHLVLHHDPEIAVGSAKVTIADTDLDGLRAIRPDLATVPEVLAEFPRRTVDGGGQGTERRRVDGSHTVRGIS